MKKIMCTPKWIDEKSIKYDNHHITGICFQCLKKVRKGFWDQHG